jgi:hypothetical protein
MHVSVSATEWLAAFAAQLGLDSPSGDECSDILALAGTAAHDSERMAAPIACWLAAKAGLEAGEAREIALRLVIGEAPLGSNDLEVGSDPGPT